MAVTLLQAGDHLSLEFEDGDLRRVGRCIRARYPDAGSRWAGFFRVHTFGGWEFVFQNEWDDPCLISNSNEGDAILRSLHGELTSA